jgi:pyocin large subunit-like protein
VSFDALSWAAKQSPGSSGAKLVLLGLAECAHRKDGRAFPSLAELVEFSSLNRKSVIANLDKLEAGGFIVDTGERVGRTKQVKVYALRLERVPEVEPSQKRNGTVYSAKSPKNGTRNLSEPITPVSSNEETAPPAQNGKVVATVPQFQEAWNTIAVPNGAVECRRMGPERCRKARPFLNRYPIEDITEAIHAVARSDFLCGRGRDNFRADIEFLFSPKHMNRLLEGFYDR